MSWLDNVLAVPAIGIRLKTKISSRPIFKDSFFDFFEDIASKYGEIDIKKLNIWGYEIQPQKNSGFNYILSPDNIIVQFTYRIKQKKIAGKFPIMEYPDYKLFSDIVALNIEEVRGILDIIKPINGIEYDRIGIVADVNISEDLFPPGIISWIQLLESPWEHKLIKADALLLAKINETENYIEQCHHAINFDRSNPESDILFKLDWQRNYKNFIPLKNGEYINELDSCLSSANHYFDIFGEGALNYE